MGLIAPRLNAQIPRPVVGSSVHQVQQPAPSPVVFAPILAFRSGFWLNLNHFLYTQGQLQHGFAVASDVQGNLAAEEAVNLSSLSPAERQAWQNAVAYYAANFAESELAYDSFLIRIDDRLSDMAACPDIVGDSTPACEAGIDPGVAAALEEAAPVYRAHWWNQQNRANLAWISQITPLLRQYGLRTVEGLNVAFNNVWPAEPIPVDVVPYAGDSGAYTTFDPMHMVLSSHNSFNRGMAGLEAVFREASLLLAEPVQQAIVSQCRQQTKPVPRDLWYALTAYTTDEVFVKSLAGQDLPKGQSLASLAETNRDYVAALGWQRYEQLLELYWQPYLDGQSGMEYAIEQMVGAL